MASTIITTNAQALSRASDAIKTLGENPSKNALLNALAAAIAGPGHDWAFIKNAPGQIFVQPGLTPSQTSLSPASDTTAAANVWALHYDERDDWGSAPMLFDSKEAALRHVREDHNWWRHSDHPFNDVMAALENIGQYTFEPEDDFQDDYSPYQIWLQELQVNSRKVVETPDVEEEVKLSSSHLVFFDAPMNDREQGLSWDTIIFKDEEDLLAYVEKHDVEEYLSNWKDYVKPAQDCEIEATFSPEAWINDYATMVDPEGDQTWVISADELEPDQSDLDYLKTSHKSPKWVREWTGPFTITLEITHGDLSG